MEPFKRREADFHDQFVAIFKKRFQLYTKNLVILYEVLVPVVLVSIGLAFSKVQFFIDSDARNLVPQLYPLKQDIIYNQELLVQSGNDI